MPQVPFRRESMHPCLHLLLLRELDSELNHLLMKLNSAALCQVTSRKPPSTSHLQTKAPLLTLPSSRDR